MAPYNQYNTYYTPPQDQSNASDQSLTYQGSRGNSTPQFLEPSAPTLSYQNLHASQYQNQNSSQYQNQHSSQYQNHGYGRPWNSSNTQSEASHDNRAAEALSHLSAQDHGQTPITSRRNPQYGSTGLSTLGFPSPTVGGGSATSYAPSRSTAVVSPVYSSTRGAASNSPLGYAARPTYNASASMTTGTNQQNSLSEQQRITPMNFQDNRTGESSTTAPSVDSDLSASRIFANTVAPSRSYSPSQYTQVQRSYDATDPPPSSVRSTQATGPYYSSTTSQRPNQIAEHSRGNVQTQPMYGHQQTHGSPVVTSNRDLQRERYWSADFSAPTTVDPTQVYDPYSEVQRKAAEERKKLEAAERARRAVEMQLADEKRKEEERKAEEARQAEVARLEQAEAARKEQAEAARKEQAEAARREQPEAAKKEQADAQRKIQEEARRKASAMKKAQAVERSKAEVERKRRSREAVLQEASNSIPSIQRQGQASVPAVAQASSPALQPSNTPAVERGTADISSGPGPEPVSSGATKEDLEAQMREMFLKMREFNSKDPTLLARLWEQERQAHAQQQLSVRAPVVVSPAAEGQTPTLDPARATPSAPQAPPKVLVKESKDGSATPVPHAGFALPNTTALPRSLQGVSSPLVANSRSTPMPAASLTPSVFAGQPVGGANAATLHDANRGSRISTAVWPPGKKRSLAEAAARWLSAHPGNSGKVINADDISRLLDSNPSYVNLCEAVEQLGFKLERAAFAKTLLSAVPDINTPKQRTQQATPLPTSTLDKPPSSQLQRQSENGASLKLQSQKSTGVLRQDGTPTQPWTNTVRTAKNMIDLTNSTSPALQDNATVVGDMDDGPSLSLMHQADVAALQAATGANSLLSINGSVQAVPRSQASKQVKSPYFGAPPQNKFLTMYGRAHTAFQDAVSQPVSKEAAARKRTFGDLVDLTAEDSDEEIFRPYKARQLQTSYGAAPPAPMVTDHAPFPNGTSSFQLYAYDPSRGTSTPANGVAPRLPQPAKVMPRLPNAAEVVEMIRRENVARKSMYDSRTIARDVLLATGRHPDMRALNAHLEPLKKLLKLPDNADLSTLQWDILDPGEPLAPVAPVTEDVDMFADDEDEPAAPLTSVRQQIDDGHGTLTSVALDAPAAGPKIQPPLNKRRGRPPRQVDNWVHTSTQATGGGEQRGAESGRVSGAQCSVSSPMQARGLSGAQPAAHTPSQAALPGSSGSAGRVNGPPTIGYAALRALNPQYDENGKLIIKKGRPVGWRKSVHGLPDRTNNTPTQPSSLRNVSTPWEGQAAAATAKRRGTARAAAVEITRPAEPRKFAVYRCEWQRCKSELHNLDVLRKHVIKIHGKDAPNGGYDCLWGKCAKTHDNKPHATDGEVKLVEDTAAKNGIGKQGSQDRTPHFSTFDEWTSHMNKKHLSPIAWKLGDGPADGSDASEHSDTYLSDACGRRVTPLIVVPEVQILRSAAATDTSESGARISGTMPPPARRPGRPSKRPAAQLQLAQEALEDLRRKKAAVGWGMDRGGSVLATEKRRAWFLDDEDFEEEGSDDGS
ncbi:hypothetical protein LTR50_006248 [Elasticomyces elasticus]|nr:hypothetical protein LTR50_006248 [Elasticomyces elasticus]